MIYHKFKSFYSKMKFVCEANNICFSALFKKVYKLLFIPIIFEIDIFKALFF